MKKYILFLLMIAPLLMAAQRSNKKLETNIKAAITGFNGDIGIYIKDLRTGKTVAINADSIFPTASIVKVPIMVGIVDKLTSEQLQAISQTSY